MNETDENKVMEIVEELPVYRGVFINKKQLIRKLEIAFPEKKEESFDQSMKRMDKEVNEIAEGKQ